jgi:16S rRNA (guanine966-N2)-methyltransferase
MRVIAGTLGGRRLTAVPGTATRPTADRVREALFSRLQSRYRLAGIGVLDLYAGTGALGIEAISRGARILVSVERNRRAARVLLANIEQCGLSGRAEVVVRDVRASLAALAAEGLVFEGVFVDPPYEQGVASATLSLLANGPLVAEGGWVSVETASRESLPEREGVLVRVRQDVYGDTKITLYERGGAEGGGIDAG